MLGGFNNEVGEKYHLMPVPLKTNSGREPIVWIDRMIGWYTEKGILSGPVFRDRKGECGKYGDWDHAFLTRVARVQVRNPELFAKAEINVFNDFTLGRSG